MGLYMATAGTSLARVVCVVGGAASVVLLRS